MAIFQIFVGCQSLFSYIYFIFFMFIVYIYVI